MSETTVMNNLLTEYTDRRVWSLTGYTLTELCFAFDLTVIISRLDGTGIDHILTIVIETFFTLRQNGQEQRFDPVQGHTLAPALILLHKPVESLTAFRDGRLCLKLADSTEVTVEKDEQFESWNTFGRGELADVGMLCSPHEGPPWLE